MQTKSRERHTYGDWPTQPVTVETGSVIHWDRAYYTRNSYYRVPVTCGSCGRERTIEATKTRCKDTAFNGLCYRCNIDYQIAHVGYGETHAAWKGGRMVTGGYVVLQVSILSEQEQAIAMPMAKKSWKHSYVVAEHRLVMALHLGRPLRTDEVVHHRDGNRKNNHIDNLEITTGSNHRKLDVKYYKLWQEALARIAELETQLLRCKEQRQ